MRLENAEQLAESLKTNLEKQGYDVGDVYSSDLDDDGTIEGFAFGFSEPDEFTTYEESETAWDGYITVSV